jgi:acyl-CoA thioesterase-1
VIGSAPTLLGIRSADYYVSANIGGLVEPLGEMTITWPRRKRRMISPLPRELVRPAGGVNRRLGLQALAALFVAALTLPATGRAEKAPMRIVAFGDSLTAGFQLPASAAFPAQLEAWLRARGHAVEVINSGVSGDTTAAGLERFDWAVPEGAAAAIVELGANDALRGLPPAEARRNLERIVARLKERGIEVLIAGMSAPRNWGPRYVAEFDAIFPDLAQSSGALLYPFFLEGVALRPELNLADGMHPNAKGVAVIVERIGPLVEKLIGRVKPQPARAP